jgi:hypothetical protein
VLGIGVEEREVAVGELHHDLAIDVGAIFRVVGTPGVRDLVDSFLQRLEVLEQRADLSCHGGFLFRTM